MEDTKMTNKTISEQLAFLVKAIIENGTYPGGLELSEKQRHDLAEQLKKMVRNSNDLKDAGVITDAFYKDRVVKHFKSMDTNFSWLLEILEHELVSASRLQKLLLDLAQEEHFSEKSIKKINQYFEESTDHGDNDNFVTLSSADIIDSIERTESFKLDEKPKRKSAHTPDQDDKPENPNDNIINLKDY